MTLEEYLLLGHIQTTLSALVAIISFVKFKSRDMIVKLIGFVFLTSFLANISSLALYKFSAFKGFTNSPHVIYLVVSFLLLSKVYQLTLPFINTRWFILIAIIFTTFTLSNVFFIQKTTPNSYSNILHSSILIVYSLLYFYVLMRDLPSLYVHHIPMFWFNSGLLIFHAGAFFLFSFTSYLVNVLKNDLLIYWSFHNMLSIFEHLIITIGLYYDLKFLHARKIKTDV